MKKMILIVLVLAAILGFLFWKYGYSLLSGTVEEKEITLTYWGLYDEEADFKQLAEDYRLAHPKVRINYIKQSATNYRLRLQAQLHAGSGPDIFWIHNSWLPMVYPDLSTAPDAVININDFNKMFYPVAKNSLTSGNKIYGLPLEIDGLALYYNTDILQAANVAPPKTWSEFVEGAKRMTVPDRFGQIQTAGAAMGTASNVNHWSEIIGTLFLQQPSASLWSPNNRFGADVIRFYTDFVTNPQNKTWDVTLPNSTEMFTTGRLAFYFGTAREAGSLHRTNPNLKFESTAVPRLPDGKSIAWGSFWSLAVSNRTVNQQAAWDFANYLVSPRALQIKAALQVQSGGYRIPYPRVEMAGLLSNDLVLDAFTSQGPTYRSGYLNSDTGDAGLNDEMVALYAKVIKAVLGGGDAQSALKDIEQEIVSLRNKYSIPEPSLPYGVNTPKREDNLIR